MKLDPGLVGISSDAVTFRWDPRDVMLYALAVGAGSDDPTEELSYTTENTEGVDLRVLPTFATLMTRSAPWPRFGVNVDRIVHASQSITVDGTVPIEGEAKVSSRIVGVVPKSKGSLVLLEADAKNVADDRIFARALSGLFFRGVESERSGYMPSERPAPTPMREPDNVHTTTTRGDQALLYRLTGDRHRLHSDPDYAHGAGFERPILHGLCTFGIAGRALSHVCVDSSTSLRHVSARFTAPVFPGDVLETHMWRDGPLTRFRTITREGVVVLDGGEASTTAVSASSSN